MQSELVELKRQLDSADQTIVSKEEELQFVSTLNEKVCESFTASVREIESSNSGSILMR